MIKHLDDRCLTDRASLEVLHAIFTGEGNRLNLRHMVRVGCCTGLVLLGRWCLGQVDHVSNENFYRNVAAVTFVDPLLDFLKTASLSDVEHVEAGRAAVDVLMDVFVMALPTWHVEIHNFVLVGIVDVIGCFDMQFG